MRRWQVTEPILLPRSLLLMAENDMDLAWRLARERFRRRKRGPKDGKVILEDHEICINMSYMSHIDHTDVKCHLTFLVVSCDLIWPWKMSLNFLPMLSHPGCALSRPQDGRWPSVFLSALNTHPAI